MKAGTSPAITALPGGGFEAAFQANTGTLWTVGSAATKNWSLGMKAGTSPAITALPGAGFEVAFQANSAALWTVGVGSGSHNQQWSLGMMTGTSPSISSIAARWSVPGSVISNLDTAAGSPYLFGQKVVALTFDDGPNPTYTPQILQILVNDRVPASFQIVGEYGSAYQSILRQEAAAGMALVNHTWTHADLATLPASQWGYQVDQTDSLLQNITGKPAACLRPPYGYTNSAVVGQLGDRGLGELMWDIDPSDYTTPGASVIAQRVLCALHPGAIIILHDGGGNRSQTAAALPSIIAGIQAAGYQIVPVCQG
jgi:peptidoglycan/xylan/chitin deacetylase (PgdA/CDA1 family)